MKAMWCCWLRRVPSYDQYPNYLRRGEDFKRVVHEVLA